jgi:ABC-type multidrug transport system fused ATPase/permease subunit
MPYYLLVLIQHWLSLVLDLTCAGMAVLIVGLAAATRHSVSLGFTAVALVSLISFSDNLKVFVNFWTMTETSLGALVRIRSFAAEVEPEVPRDRSLSDPAPDWPAHGSVEIRDVTVTYKRYISAYFTVRIFSQKLTASSSSLPAVLRGLSLSIRAGRRLAICGRSGR